MKKILVVEDNEKNLDLVRILLTSAGYKVTEARDGLEAIDKAFAEDPDLILMDMQLPLLDGYEATRRIKSDERSAKIPVIALTSYAMKDDRQKSLDAGCAEYIQKPINPATFIEEITPFLDLEIPESGKECKMKILIVDDNLKNLDILQIMLGSKGYEVISAQNGQIALEKAGTNLPDLVISDILMPVMDGYQLCQEWKKDSKLKKIPFVFNTATYSDERDEELALKLGADKFIRKPVEPDEFMEMIQNFIEKWEKGKIETKRPVFEEDKSILKLYNERLVNRLEKISIDLKKEIKIHKLTEAKLEKKTHDLGERIKELDCLYSILTVCSNPNISMEEIFQSVAEFIPPAWQFPDITCSRIIIDGNQYKTGNFKETKWKQSGKIIVSDEQVGTIEVCYLEERPQMDEGPFLKEEKDLIIVIVDLIGRIIERKNAEDNNKKLESQLQQAQKMESVGRLAGGVAHDFNNALSVIISTTELALDDVDPTGQLHEDLNEIFMAGKRAADITRQLLAFARKQTIAPKILDLNESVKSMLKMLRRLIGEDIDLIWMPGKTLWSVKMDPSQIDQILANLCVNARDAIEGVGKLTIELRNVTFTEDYSADYEGFVQGEFVQLTVSDNGCGMNKEILSKIFEPFFTTKDVDKGTGLGLAMVYGIVKQNNGFINVYSEPDKGTSIKIYLTKHEDKAVEIHKESHEEIPTSQGETILVVEDDPPILKIMQKILEGLGYTVLTSGAPEKTMDIVKEYTGKIHLLITDVIMPKMNGIDLVEQLQPICPDFKYIFMSGYTADAIVTQGVLDKGVNFIQKPFSRRDLAEIVRKVLDENNGKEKNYVQMKKILIIDDETSFRKTLKKLLEKNSYKVIDAQDGNQGIKLFKEHSPDLIITDLLMPEKEGLETIKEIRELNPDIKIIAMSGGVVVEPEMYLNIAKKFGAQYSFAKPIDNEELLLAVRNLLSNLFLRISTSRNVE